MKSRGPLTTGRAGLGAQGSPPACSWRSARGRLSGHPLLRDDRRAQPPQPRRLKEPVFCLWLWEQDFGKDPAGRVTCPSRSGRPPGAPSLGRLQHVASGRVSRGRLFQEAESVPAGLAEGCGQDGHGQSGQGEQGQNPLVAEAGSGPRAGETGGKTPAVTATRPLRATAPPSATVGLLGGAVPSMASPSLGPAAVRSHAKASQEPPRVAARPSIPCGCGGPRPGQPRPGALPTRGRSRHRRRLLPAFPAETSLRFSRPRAGGRRLEELTSGRSKKVPEPTL